MNWQTFLNDVFLGDQESIEFVQRLIGYTASGDKSLSIIPVLHGAGPGGKTTFVLAIRLGMAGKLVFGGELILELLNTEVTPNPDLMSLYGAKIVAFYAVGAQKAHEMSHCLKRLASDAPIVVQGVFDSDVMTFRNQATPLLIANEIPEVFFKNNALGARGVFIPFNARFAPNSIPGRINFDCSEIKTWIAEGLEMWRKEGLLIPERFRLAGLNASCAA